MIKQKSYALRSVNAKRRVNVLALEKEVKQLRFEVSRLTRTVAFLHEAKHQHLLNEDFDERLLALEQEKGGGFLVRLCRWLGK